MANAGLGSGYVSLAEAGMSIHVVSCVFGGCRWSLVCCDIKPVSVTFFVLLFPIPFPAFVDWRK
jgi:hypothetical protein